MENTPFAIQVDARLQAELVNQSAQPQFVLHDAALQPSRLRLFLPSGKELDSQDERRTQKFDNSVSREMYARLAPAAHLALSEPLLTRDGAVFGLQWGPYAFGGLSPGTYSAQIEWVSQRNDYLTDSGKPEIMPGIWLGTVRSKRVSVRLPF